MKNTFYFWILISISFINCISMRKTAEIKEDKFSKFITILGKENKITEGIFDTGGYYLRTWIDKETKKMQHQVYINFTYAGSGWRFYRNANNKEMEPLEFVKISHDVNCEELWCYYTEIFGVIITNEYLKNHLKGFPIKVYAKSGHTLLIQLTTEQIKSQLIKIYEYKKEKNL